MRENFRRDKIKKEELRRKKQEEKRNKRLHKKDPFSAPSAEVSVSPVKMTDPGTSQSQPVS